MLKKQINNNPLIIVISGPSGVGKDATIARIKERGAKFHYVVTTTTRAKRTSESEGKDYYFVSKSDFARKIQDDEFLEFALVYDNYYGVSKREVTSAIEKGEDVILKVDVQGAETLKKKIPHAIYIFLLPSKLSELKARLKKRNADSEKDLKVRLDKAEHELKKVAMFDYQVVNFENDLDKTAEIVKAIVIAEKCKVKQHDVKSNLFLTS
jgi:guanylate kinase